MAKSPRDLDDDDLIARVRQDAKDVRAGEPLEDNAPVDLEDPPVELDVDGVNTD